MPSISSYFTRPDRSKTRAPLSSLELTSDNSCDMSLISSGQNQQAESSGLEQELTCSVCFEILYQPLTLLDCLHTFCGSCLREWFAWQKTANASSSWSSSRDFTCPGCRAPVRDTKQNATVTTLLDMYLRINPEKAKSQKEQFDIARSYKPGDRVIPATVRRPSDSSSEDGSRPHPPSSRDSLTSETGFQRRRAERAQRHVRRHQQPHERTTSSSNTTSRPVDSAAPSPSASRGVSRGNRSQRSLGHSSSLRSILSNSDVGELDLQEEIIQQIEEEGMLDGIDIENMTADQEDEFTERIVCAYQRRLQESEARRATLRSDHHHRTAVNLTTSSEVLVSTSPNPRTRTTTLSSRPRTGSSSRTNQLRQESNRAHRSRARSGGRERAIPRPPRTNRDSTGALYTTPTPAIPLTRSICSSPVIAPIAPLSSSASGRIDHQSRPAELPALSSFQFERVALGPQSSRGGASSLSCSLTRQGNTQVSPSVPASLSSTASSIAPRICCSNCERRDIQSQLHYTCNLCRDGQYVLCQICYRLGVGCDDWTGRSHQYFGRYLTLQQGSESGKAPHILSASRYVTRMDGVTELQRGAFCDICSEPADSCYWHCGTCNEGAWGYCNACVQKGKHCTHALTAIVHKRYLALDASGQDLLQVQAASGAPVSKSLPANMGALANDAQNDQAAPINSTPALTHDVLPHFPISEHYRNAPISTTCDICRQSIILQKKGYHCQECNEGNFDVCKPCYRSLISRNRISPQNGSKGWRRCPRGHRMIVVHYTSTDGTRISTLPFPMGLQRTVVKDVVGGRSIQEPEATAFPAPEGVSGSATLSHQAHEHRQTPAETSAITGSTASASASMVNNTLRVRAIWSYFPDAADRDSSQDIQDELQFPRGAEITDAHDENGEWFSGFYAGKNGLFPAAYCREIV